MFIAPVFISQSGGTKNSPSTSIFPSKAPISAQNHEAPLAELGTLRVRFAHPFYPTPRFAENPARDSDDLLKIQQDRERQHDGIYIYILPSCTSTDSERERERERGKWVSRGMNQSIK